jgi:hypothetical protein
MPRYVILEHDHPYLHWDLMLELDGVLRTWRLLRTPVRAKKIPAEPIGDHRLMYLDYEGPVDRNRGAVTRWDAGDYGFDERTEKLWRVHVAGHRLRGALALYCDREAAWWAEYEPD